MALIRVDPAELLSASTRIEAAVAVGDEVAADAKALLASAAASGRGDAASAIESFITAWAGGMTFLSEDGRTLADLLRQSGQAYDATDLKIGEAAQG